MPSNLINETGVRRFCHSRNKKCTPTLLKDLEQVLAVKLANACRAVEQRINSLYPEANEPVRINTPSVPRTPGVMVIKRCGPDWLASYHGKTAAAPSQPVTSNELLRGEYDLGIMEARAALCELDPNFWNVKFVVSNL